MTRVLNEGKKVGLIGQDYQAVDDTVFTYLATVAEYPMDEAELIPDFGETIERLRSQARKGSTFASGRKRQGARFKK